MPILGIVASSQQSAFISTGSYESIATATVGSTSVGRVDITSIPSTYQHLQVRITGRNTFNSSGMVSCSLTLNDGDGNIHYLSGDGSSAFTDYNSAISYPFNLSLPGVNATANAHGAAIIDILDYANTNKTKVLRSFSGSDLNGSGVVRLNSSLFDSTSAVSKISLWVYNNAANLSQYTTVALYGIKG
jgi:hypothetical protein